MSFLVACDGKQENYEEPPFAIHGAGDTLRMSQGNGPQEKCRAYGAATVADPFILRLRFETSKGPVLLAYFHVAALTLFDTRGVVL